MLDYRYDSSEYKENNYQLIPVGDHRVRIEEAEEKKSQSGMDMIKLTLKVSGYAGKLWYYLVVNPEYMQLTHQKFGEVFESFGIKPGDMNILNWRGRVGAARIKHGEYKGDPKAEVSYFLSKKKQEGLSAWAEEEGFASVRDEDEEIDIPF